MYHLAVQHAQLTPLFSGVFVVLSMDLWCSRRSCCCCCYFLTWNVWLNLASISETVHSFVLFRFSFLFVIKYHTPHTDEQLTALSFLLFWFCFVVANFHKSYFSPFFCAFIFGGVSFHLPLLFRCPFLSINLIFSFFTPIQVFIWHAVFTFRIHFHLSLNCMTNKHTISRTLEETIQYWCACACACEWVE